MGREWEREIPPPPRKPSKRPAKRKPDKGGDLCLLAVFLTTAALVARMRRGQQLAE